MQDTSTSMINSKPNPVPHKWIVLGVSNVAFLAFSFYLLVGLRNIGPIREQELLNF
jgi:hypothetical protein